MTWGRTFSTFGTGLGLGEWGHFEIPDRRHLRLVGKDGRSLDIAAGELLGSGSDLTGWFDPEFGVAVIGNRSPEILRVELDSGDSGVVARIDRFDEPDLRFLSFHEGADMVFCLYECGLVGFDLRGNVRWQVHHDDISAEFAGVKDGAVWIRSQWPPQNEGRSLGFRLADGAAMTS